MKEISLIYNFLKSNEIKSINKNNLITNLLKDNEITEIMMNGFNQIFYEVDNKIYRQENSFNSKREYHTFIESILSENNIIINESRPIVDFKIGEDLRINLIKESISNDDYIVSIRRRKSDLIDIDCLVEKEFCSGEVMEFVVDKVKNKKNIFISGQTSTGKTTFLNSLLKTIDKSERIIIIEDTQEIKLPKEYNAINLISRERMYDSTKVSISDLIKSSLRMRPDRIILGEIRREEVIQFIYALNTGHSGSICTGHSNSGHDMYNRLIMLLLEQGIPDKAAHMQLGLCIDYLIHLSRKNFHRRIISIEKLEYINNNTQIDEIVKYNYRREEYEWKDH